MARFTYKQLKEAERTDRANAKKLDEGLEFKSFAEEEKIAPKLMVTVYRLEFPKLSNPSEMVKMLKRITEQLRYYHEDNSYVAIICYSEHKKWTPYAKVSQSKGGHPRKVFSHANSYLTAPHLHCYISGSMARTVAEKVWKSSKRYYEKRWNTNYFPSFQMFARSQNYFPIEYVRAQATYKREIGDIDAFIESHRAKDEIVF